MIEFKNIYKSFKSQSILNNLNLTVPEGNITVIMGPSGAGKSVTLKLLMGLLKPDSGEVTVDDQSVCNANDLEMNKIRGKIGMLFQDCLLYTSPSPRDRTRSRMPSSA